MTRTSWKNNSEESLFTIVNNEEQRFWKVRPLGASWSDIHSINIPLYLEEQENFFTLIGIPDTTQNTETELTITAADPNYIGDITLSIPTGTITLNMLSIENGTITTEVSFDMPQENTKITIQANNHNTLQGKSKPFRILHAINYAFFSIPAVIEAQTGRTFTIPLSAEDSTYTGKVLASIILLVVVVGFFIIIVFCY